MNIKKRKSHSEAEAGRLKRITRTNTGWMSTAEPFIVDRIVASLKNHPAPKFCWYRTGPSLRRLNKYWYHEMDRHIVAVDLRVSHVNAAIQSLAKFPNLTSLNTVQYQFHPSECFTLVPTLQKVPRLSRLVMDAESIIAAKRKDLDGLVCEVLELKERHIVHASDFNDLVLGLSCMRMNHLMLGIHGSILGRGWMTRLLANVPSVKRLTVAVFSDDDFEALAAVKELELTYLQDNHQCLATLTSLVSLRVTFPVPNFEAFQALDKLKVLHVAITTGFAFDRTFYNVIGRLEKMSIYSGLLCQSVALPADIWEAIAGLKEIEIESMDVDTSRINHSCFRGLQDVALSFCNLTGEMIAWNRLTTLTRLSLINVSDGNRNSILGSMDLSSLQKLSCLTLVCQCKDMSTKLMQSIKHISNLEDLSLRYKGNQMELDHQAPAVESLKQLPHLMSRDIRPSIAHRWG